MALCYYCSNKGQAPNITIDHIIQEIEVHIFLLVFRAIFHQLEDEIIQF